MVVKIFDSAETAGAAAAVMFTSQVLEKPESVLGFATGSTPLPTYSKMIELFREGIADYSGVTTFNLDEYAGIDSAHEQSYKKFMMDNLFNGLNVPGDKIHVLNGVSGNHEKECADFEAMIDEAGGIDLQILGIGHNGHIGFNEPGTSFVGDTSLVTLTESTIEANKRFFASADEVPKQALSMGIGTIMRARKIVMVATGAGKKQAVLDMVKGAVDPSCPASILQFHPNVTVLLDKEAAELL